MKMFHRLLAVALVSIIPGTDTALALGIQTDLQVSSCNFGDVYAFQQAACQVWIENRGDTPADVTLTAKQVGDTIEPAELSIPPRGWAIANVHVDVGDASGEAVHWFQVTGASFRPTYLHANGFVMSALAEPKPFVSFGRIDMSTGDMAEKTTALDSHEVPDFGITGVLHKPQGLDVDLGKDLKTVRIRVRPDVAWGILDDDIKLQIDTPRQTQAWVHVGGEIVGDVGPRKNPFWFGSVPPGPDRVIMVPLENRRGNRFSVDRLSVSGIDATADVVPCIPAVPACKSIRLHVMDTQRAGVAHGTVVVGLADRNLIVRVFGIFRAHTDAESAADPTGASPWLPELLSDLGRVEDEDVQHVPGAALTEGPPPGTGPLLKWSAVDERDAYGYQIFRASSETAPYVLLNADIIPAHATPTAYPYQWRDDGAVPGHTYWYYIGVVYRDGHKAMLSGPKIATAKGSRP